MTFHEPALGGAYLVRTEDARGGFARTWCAREFADRGLTASMVQAGVAYDRRRGTLRGLHYQAAPHGQAKLVMCLRGAVYDAIVDLRPGSATYGRWAPVELAGQRTMRYLPDGFAHGYQTRDDDTEVFYRFGGFDRPEAERGIRWDDPALGIAWPPADRTLSPRDLAWPDFRPRAAGGDT